MATLRVPMTVNGVSYAAGETPTPEHADLIRNPAAWTGGIVPARNFAIVREGALSLADPRVGVRLDGSDESARLNSAFTLMPASGGELFMPPGALCLGSEVTLPANVSLTGATVGGSVISPSAGYTGRLLSTDGYNRISHLQFHGKGTSGVLLTVRKPRSIFTQLHFSNSGTDAIEFAGSAANSSAHANKMTDINIEDCVGRGIFLNSWCYDNEFVNTWIGECGVGVRLQDGACFFNTLHVWGCVGNGVEVRSPGGNKNLFQNVYLETNGTGGSGSGIDIFQANGTQVIGGRLWKNASSGASVNAAPRTRLMGLDIHENGSEGVRGIDSLYCQVIGNSFYDVSPTPSRQDRPINTTGTCDSWIVTGNVMRAADHVVGAKVLAGAANVVANNIE